MGGEGGGVIAANIVASADSRDNCHIYSSLSKTKFPMIGLSSTSVSVLERNCPENVFFILRGLV